ncbi:hypothetical protein B0T25DRAFT_528346 [Lasiosphaeria hispida]|uniref:Uncharacterized protein n=1 Tax=Lasiosphaeria hispida TaxID=260671 RepID=A0AAJ0MKE4_9PEZI|nr:hypothetical protein B0T25DRAFT_528346 [Lasiosphaeria hispida]
MVSFLCFLVSRILDHPAQALSAARQRTSMKLQIRSATDIHLQTPQGFAVAVSTVPSEFVAVQAIQKAAKPQRLQQILASLHYLLTFNTEAQDYHFIVDPVDSAILTGRRIGQLERLINRVTNSTIQVAQQALVRSRQATSVAASTAPPEPAPR